jgi:excisionase family DNA binding protein
VTVGAVLALSPRSWAHVAVALATHAVALEDRHATVPREVVLLMETAAELARSGPHPARTGHGLEADGLICDGLRMDGERLLSFPEAARYTSLSERTIRRRVASGELESAKLGRRRVVRVRDLRQWADAQKER